MRITPADLPNDRAYLHFECIAVRPSAFQVDYELVLPLRSIDARGLHDNDGGDRPPESDVVWLDRTNNRRMPLGRTMIETAQTEYPVFGNTVDLPYRDGVHALWDNERLGGLPVFYSTPSGEHFQLAAE